MVQALLLMLEWQDHIQVADKNFHVSLFLYDLAISGQYCNKHIFMIMAEVDSISKLLTL